MFPLHCKATAKVSNKQAPGTPGAKLTTLTDRTTNTQLVHSQMRNQGAGSEHQLHSILTYLFSVSLRVAADSWGTTGTEAGRRSRAAGAHKPQAQLQNWSLATTVLVASCSRLSPFLLPSRSLQDMPTPGTRVCQLQVPQTSLTCLTKGRLVT